MKCWDFKVAWLDFFGLIPSKFEHLLRLHEQRYGKKVTTTVLYKDENFLWSGFYCNRSRYGNVMTPLRFLFIFVFLCTRSFIVVWLHWKLHTKKGGNCSERSRVRRILLTCIQLLLLQFLDVIWSMPKNFAFFQKPLDKSFYKFDNSEINRQEILPASFKNIENREGF